MATIKKKKKTAKPHPEAASRSPLERAKSLIKPRLRVILALVVVALLGWGMNGVWRRVAPSIIHRPPYLLAAQRITVTPPPEWITADVRNEVIRCYRTRWETLDPR